MRSKVFVDSKGHWHCRDEVMKVKVSQGFINEKASHVAS